MNLRTLKIGHYMDILQVVSGKVFHVTSEENMESIKKSGGLIPNLDLEFLSSFGKFPNGYFRKRGCVSFFDYRCYGTPEWEAHAYKCFPTQSLMKGERLFLLFLRESDYTKLIPWTEWKNEGILSDRVVPWVETGYKGMVSLDSIKNILVVEYI